MVEWFVFSLNEGGREVKRRQQLRYLRHSQGGNFLNLINIEGKKTVRGMDINLDRHIDTYLKGGRLGKGSNYDTSVTATFLTL